MGWSDGVGMGRSHGLAIGMEWSTGMRMGIVIGMGIGDVDGEQVQEEVGMRRGAIGRDVGGGPHNALVRG